MVEEQDSLAATIYEIRIKGHLNSQWDEWFYDLAITHEPGHMLLTDLLDRDLQGLALDQPS